MDNLVKNNIAIIPARGGSKRLPGKNIMNFFGKPMIAWTIDAALKTNLFDVVLVSTDNQEIAEISKSFGAEVPFLRNQHFDDQSTASQATITALEQMEANFNTRYETVVQLMPNCPLRNAQSILNQFNQFENNSFRSTLLSGFKYGMFNPWWAHYKDEKGLFKPLMKEFRQNKRSQDLPNLICPSGATWISSYDKLKQSGTFYSGNYTFFEIDWMQAVDIDDKQDLELAKAVYLLNKNNN